MTESAATPNAKQIKKAEIARGRNIGMLVVSVLMACWYGYSPVINWWDRKGFETVVEKTLADRGIATEADTPQFATVEHGVGTFKSRNLQAVVVKAEFNQIDLAAGEKTPRCILVYSLIDKEFGVYRAMSLADCSEPEALKSWKTSINYH